MSPHPYSNFHEMFAHHVSTNVCEYVDCAWTESEGCGLYDDKLLIFSEFWFAKFTNGLRIPKLSDRNFCNPESGIPVLNRGPGNWNPKMEFPTKFGLWSVCLVGWSEHWWMWMYSVGCAGRGVTTHTVVPFLPIHACHKISTYLCTGFRQKNCP